METFLNNAITWNIFMQNLGTWLKVPMEAFSFLGNEYFFLFLLPALYWCVETSLGLQVGIVLLLSTSLNESLKLAFHGPRPYWFSPNVISYSTETSFGIPSGHAQIAVGVWGMLAARMRKGWGWLVAVLIVLLIGISRIYLGVHFVQDVVLGWLIGALVLWLVLRFWDPIASRFKNLGAGSKILWFFVASLALVLLSLIPFLWLKLSNWQPPQAWAAYAQNAVSLSGTFTSTGTFFGLLTGLVWFKRQGGFNAKGLLWKRILRFVVGGIGVLVLYLGLKILFGLIAPDTEAVIPYLLRFIRYALIGFWVSAGAPWVFIKIKLAENAS